MPYTLVKMLLWIVVAIGLGIVTGWLLRNVTARRQIARARNQRGDNAEHGEVERLRGRITTLESTIAERDRRIAGLEAEASGSAADSEPASPEASAGPAEALIGAPVDPELARAETVLGTPVSIDDLRLIVGIGPTVEELCHGIGIRTWADLAATEVSLLQTMLNDAGARSKTNDPTTWPRQAELLAARDWESFAALRGDLTASSDASTS